MFGAALLSGAVAITLNSVALAAADLVPLATAHGGLLRLLSQLSGIAPPKGAAFQAWFHAGVGGGDGRLLRRSARRLVARAALGARG